MSDLKRTPSSKRPADYPAAKEVMRHRREFLALLAKGAVGVGVLGVLGCDSSKGGEEDSWHMPGADVKFVPPQDTIGEDARTWDSGGIQPMPDSLEDVPTDEYQVQGDITPPKPDVPGILPDVHDVKDEDWTISGTDTGPEPPDVTDVKDHDWTGPAGVPPMPDTVDPEDVKDDGGEEEDLFLPGGIMPPPEED